MITPFIKMDAANPVLLPDSTVEFQDPILNQPVKWMEKDVFNPAAVVRHDTIFLLFRAEDKIGNYAGTSRIGLAWSIHGVHFTTVPEPVLYPDNDAVKKWEWEGGCEDPRVVQDTTGTYFMTYTAYDGDKARLMVASSSDLQHWKKWGRAFEDATNQKYADGWSKSGSIVSKYINGTPVAQKINGVYWMYWGDQNIWAATSNDLIHWKPVLYKEGEMRATDLRGVAKELPEVKTVFGPRAKKWDSDLVESGPPALITTKGILLLYNSRNIPSIGDTALAEGTYAAGQILLDINDPTKVVARNETYFMKPDKPYEINGQVNYVCFVEGLVYYKSKWFLYYGTADSKIAVAVSDAPMP
jgi:beta-1,2-mannosidase